MICLYLGMCRIYSILSEKRLYLSSIHNLCIIYLLLFIYRYMSIQIFHSRSKNIHKLISDRSFRQQKYFHPAFISKKIISLIFFIKEPLALTTVYN